MRPKLPKPLAEELKEEVRDEIAFYEEAGYNNATAFVTQAVKEKIKREKEANG